MSYEGEMEEADYQAECQAEAEAEGEAMAQMSAEAENEVNRHNEEIRAKEEFEIEKLSNLRKAIIELERVKIPFNIIKHNIQPLKEWLDSVLPKKG